MLLAAKIVEEILVTCQPDAVETFISGFDKVFKFGPVLHGPGNIRLFGMKIIQQEDNPCSINAEDKLQTLEPYHITRLCRRDIDSELN